MINGVRLKKLSFIPDERGRLMEILRSDENFFEKFGQVYMTTTFPDVVKGWHWHKIQADNIVCIHGGIKLVLYDSREESSTFEKLEIYYLGVYNPILIHIPPWIVHGWMCISPMESIIINIPSDPYNHKNPDEHRIDPHNNGIPYAWDRKDG